MGWIAELLSVCCDASTSVTNNVEGLGDVNQQEATHRDNSIVRNTRNRGVGGRDFVFRAVDMRFATQKTKDRSRILDRKQMMLKDLKTTLLCMHLNTVLYVL